MFYCFCAGVAYILWDNGQVGAYRYNHSGKYDIKKCREPRRVTTGNIEVGCGVKRGENLESFTENINKISLTIFI